MAACDGKLFGKIPKRIAIAKDEKTSRTRSQQAKHSGRGERFSVGVNDAETEIRLAVVRYSRRSDRRVASVPDPCRGSARNARARGWNQGCATLCDQGRKGGLERHQHRTLVADCKQPRPEISLCRIRQCHLASGRRRFGQSRCRGRRDHGDAAARAKRRFHHAIFAGRNRGRGPCRPGHELAARDPLADVVRLPAGGVGAARPLFPGGDADMAFRTQGQ